MTLEAELREAAFWHMAICLGCHETSDEERPQSCPNCGGNMVSAIELQVFVGAIEEERDEAEGN